MKNSIDDLRNHLFETIERLKDPDDTMDVKTASAIKGVADTLIESAKAELKHIELTGAADSVFLRRQKRLE